MGKVGDKLVVGLETDIPKMRVWPNIESKRRGDPPLEFIKAPGESNEEFTARVQFAIDQIVKIDRGG